MSIVLTTLLKRAQLEMLYPLGNGTNTPFHLIRDCQARITESRKYLEATSSKVSVNWMFKTITLVYV